MQTVIPYSSIFHQQSEPLRVDAHISLPAVVSNMLLMVDYVATNSTVPTTWPWQVWEQFTPEQREARARISPILVHGLILQGHWLRTIAPQDPASTEWDALRQHVADVSDHEMRELLAKGWVSGLQFYLTEMVRNERVDAHLPENPSDLTVERLVADPDLLDSLHAFTYASWGVPDSDLPAYVAFASDPARVRDGVLLLLDAVWTHGGRARWEEGLPGLQRWVDATRAPIEAGSWDDAVIAARELSGRTPPERLQPDVRSASALTLLPCLELGSNQTVVTAGDTCYLMFQPPAGGALPAAIATDGMRLAEAVSLMRALSDAAAFSLVQVLAHQEELYALELAEEAGIHQSTVSRQLAVLERNGIVTVRREGKAKYYRLRPERIDTAMRVIRESLQP